MVISGGIIYIFIRIIYIKVNHLSRPKFAKKNVFVVELFKRCGS